MNPHDRVKAILSELCHCSADQLRLSTKIGAVIGEDEDILAEFILLLTDEWDIEFHDDLVTNSDMFFLKRWTLQELSDYIHVP
jgi:hypothetical protein